MDTQLAGPTPGEVGAFYDEVNRLLTTFLGGNMHYGFWSGPDDRSDFDRAGARLTDLMVDRLRVGPGDVVLDLGCGPGKPAVHLARATGAYVVGISISTADVALAAARAAAEGMAERVRFQHADATALPFPPGSFDAVLALESIVHIPDRVHVLRQIAQVLRPGGRVALTDFVSLHNEGAKEGSEDGDELALAEMLGAWRAAPLVRPADYPGFVAQAGLVMDELWDITEHTKYTFERMYAAMTEYVAAQGVLPPDLERIYAMGADVDWAAEAARPQTEGVIIVVAHRPPA